MSRQDRFARAKSIFLEAAAIDPGGRDAFLEAKCAGDHDLRAEVEALLGADDRTRGFDVREPRASDPLVGRHVGRYRVRRLIAVGGMGAVYAAAQEQPRRIVALKLVKGALATPESRRRFEAEAEILGRLRHPGIAQIFEAGTHDDPAGPLPYFAMEYIPGARPLTTYAENQHLGTRRRLELFIEICDAVHHGHQRAIIHRDLKPSNILVDANGRPKVIDFGVARFTDSDVAITSMRTDVGRLIGTVQYMSPEQCDADPLALDTRSDVYALGVILFELLCDCPPYDLSSASIFEATRIIRQEEPTRPSRIRPALRGDLETITLKALEKDRERRYRSAAELADDIQRYLDNEPIRARPPTVHYHLSKFVRRHPYKVFMAGALAAVLVAATVVSLGFARQEFRQRVRAQQAVADQELVIGFQNDMLATLVPEEFGQAFVEDIRKQLGEETRGVRPDRDRPGPRRRPGRPFDAEGPGDATPDGPRNARQPPGLAELVRRIDKTGLARRVIGREILARAADQIDERFESRPLVQAELRRAIGRTYAALGMSAQAGSEFAIAFEILSSEPAADPADVAGAALELADVTFRSGAYEDARLLFARAESVASPIDRPDLLAAALLGRGRCLLELDGSGAETLVRRAVDLANAELGPTHDVGVDAAIALADVHMRAGRLDEAITRCNRTLEIVRARSPPDDARMFAIMTRLGRIDLEAGRLQAAHDRLERTLRAVRPRFGADDDRTLETHAAFIECLLARAEVDGALLQIDQSIRHLRPRAEPHWRLGAFLLLRGRALDIAGRDREAIDACEEAYDLLASTLGDRHARSLVAAAALRDLHSALGDDDQAAEWQRRLDADDAPPGNDP